VRVTNSESRKLALKNNTIAMRKFISFFTSIVIIISCSAQQHKQQAINIIPKPASIQINNGTFTITKSTVITVADEGDRKAAEFLNDYLQQYYGLRLDINKQEGKDYIRLFTKKFIKAADKDAYSLNITKDGVDISGDTYAGTFYGIQSLIQLLPVPPNYQLQTTNYKLSLPFVSIQDAPRFSYRGMHLDVGRHFFPVSFIKKYLDYIAFHKMNYFHWHLTEDQGWRIEIKKYPKLTEIGSCRNGTIIGRYPGKGNDNIHYCGFYTQEEVKDVVQYAMDRHITVVPEIEMPGHASAAIASYPWLSCFPEQDTKIPANPSTASTKATAAPGAVKLVQETWGVFDDVFCAGKDSTFQFLQDVIDEILPLFPSKYIHVGGDECPKNNWKKCPLCQARIKKEALKDEHGLQSYFIQRMEKYINSKGRTLIGWDEILEGGLAPNAIVMSWRGEAGGIAAAKQNHYVIMTPGNFVYFDHAQSQKEDSVTIGNYTPLDEVYSYNPVSKELNAGQAKYILGSQANVWTEYMKNPRKVEYMIFPRMSALSEVLWTEPAQKNWSDFEKRMQTQFNRYRLWGANFSNAYYGIDATITPAPKNKGLQLILKSKDKGGTLTYAIAEKHFAKNYIRPVILTEDAQVTALYAKNGNLLDSFTLNIKMNKATGKKITLAKPPSPTYPGEGAFTLVNGIINEMGLARAKEFIGYRGDNMQAIIDLGTAQAISSVIVHAITSGGSRVYAPEVAEAHYSVDGKSYKPLGKSADLNSSMPGKGNFTINFTPVTARYLQVIVKPVMQIAEGKPGAGEQAWMFLDEIEVK
jgi:hexosaminidase